MWLSISIAFSDSDKDITNQISRNKNEKNPDEHKAFNVVTKDRQGGS